ncbi:GDSL-type esterase/lipase family protein [Antarcticibacterium sp. 1MA-6-2]|uniref:GDSL-type esterase/lipase family protein n=1 Tax=Antarcticibacterium sp. 1MA-6-2 TaxID=2908210 RepID=UPI001F2B1678|nr:GDSL-type esterase/lipase family protein [Antarcticibacterium sp. 1MA-6-2]UJH90616.1 GDSL-type esterase/lipase family protein [Antarcticibacterium sp. 1MA-6-2]
MKIHLPASLIFSFFFTFSYAQTEEMDTVYRPRTYSLKVEQFRSYPDSKTDIIFLGNSLTEYTDWNELLQLPTAKNRGISGDTSFGILQRLDEVTEGKPSKIFLLVGINDISRNVPAELILRNYEKIIQQIKKASPETQLYVQTLLLSE